MYKNMRIIEINNYKMNILDVRSYVENNVIFEKIAPCERKEATIKVVVKDRGSTNKVFQYTNYYKLEK